MNVADFEVETWEQEFSRPAETVENVPAVVRPPGPLKMRRRPGDVLMDVDSRYVGKIIGKGGAKIKSLKQESGAFISVIDGIDDSMKIIKISGNPNAKDRAVKMVSDIIDANTEKYENFLEKSVKKCVEKNTSECIDWDQLKREQEEYTKKKIDALTPLVKNLYKEHPEVAALSDQQVVDFRLSKNNIMVKFIEENNTATIPKPVLKFEHAFKDYPEIMGEILKQKFESPSPVQCQAWPIIMSGHDVIAIAQTGTGKTLAFLLPAFIHTENQATPREKRKGPTVLVLAPTRELVVQIENEVQKYSYKGMRSMSIYGGASSDGQKKCLKEGVEIVIATPGRLNDFVSRRQIDLSNVSFLILDEADRMLDLGFEPQIRVSLLKVRPDRQTIMTSATWPPGVKRLAKSYTTDPIQVMVGSLDLTTVNTVKQDILIMEEEEKESWLYNYLGNIENEDKVIIFVNRKVTVDDLSISLCLKGFYVESIHGGREQKDREMALENLRTGEVHILIATDVASRGIDIDDVTVVINYDLTKDIEEYVHRVGRTGRAGKSGHAITLLTKYDWSRAKDLVELMEKSGQEVPLELRNMAKRFENKQNRDKAEGGNRSFRGRGQGRGGNGSFSGYRTNKW